MRIAMWSGPRNLSTAMMYSFDNRQDTQGIDEPFYGAFLAYSDVQHPMQDEVLRSMEQNPARVADQLADYDAPIQYEKHMIHHMLPDFPLDWMADVSNVFLLRHPARVLASYLQKREAPTADDLGFTKQLDLFTHVRSIGQTPVLIDSAAVRRNPERALSILCEQLGIPFDPAMLSWSAGPRSCDGVWASHWYHAVHSSTGFAPDEGDIPDVPDVYRPMIAEALEGYETLQRYAQLD